MDTERSRRHASKALSYPLTIGSVLHQHSAFTIRSQRLTPEGLRSLTALRTNLHVAPGAPEQPWGNKDKIRVFVLGARAESILPAGVWEQLAFLFPSATFHVYLIGPQVSLPERKEAVAPLVDGNSSQKTDVPDKIEATEVAELPKATSEIVESPSGKIWQPAAPRAIRTTRPTRDTALEYGVPSYTYPYSRGLALTGIRSMYQDIHDRFAPFDPYSDVFFAFCPGFGFRSPTSSEKESQILSPNEWGGVIQMILESKCALFVTGFSPGDIERDIRALDGVEGIAGEYDWVLTPGPNPFSSERWEVAEFDPRVLIKLNWGIWGIRGKQRDVLDPETWTL